jgi:hypothetical protein
MVIERRKEVLMVPVMDLWIPILISTVLVFFASSFLHMVLPWHRKDFAKLPNEEAVLEAIRKAGASPGDYVFPCPSSHADMRTPEMIEKYKRGPSGFMTIRPPGAPVMGKFLSKWFLYCAAVGVFVAYLSGRTFTPETEYRILFRFVSTMAFLAYAAALWQDVIWKVQSWKTASKHTIDGLIYSLLTAGAFAGFWPR